MTASTRIVLVSDTHLAARAAAFNANWQAAHDWITAVAPDQVIHLGDISAAGDETVADLHFAVSLLRRLGQPLLVLPGNHDIGDNPPKPGTAAAVPVDREKLARYRNLFGEDRWVLDAGRWRLIGLDAQLLGTGSDEEADQFAWLSAELLHSADRPIGLLLHKPMFRDGPADDEPGERYVPAAARRQLLGLVQAHDLRFVISGHTHQARHLRVDNIDHVWVPSTSFCIPDAVQEPIGRKLVGCVMLTLEDDAHRFETITPTGMQCHDLLDHAGVYPQITGLKAQLAAAGSL